MKFEIDRSARLPIPCPKCGHQQDELVSRLRDDPQITCGHCGAVFDIDGEELDELIKTLERFGR